MGAALTGPTVPLGWIVPGDVDRPTGGNVWDREVAAALRAAGTEVRWRPVAGAWPVPPEGPGDLVEALAEVGRVAVVDGLVAAAWPDVLEEASRRARLGLVVHLPLALETGLRPDDAERLDALETRALAAVDVVVATSQWCAGRLRGRTRTPVRVARPGTRPPALAPPDRPGDGTRLLAVGSLTPRKGHDVLLDALHRPAAPDVPWRLRLVGPAPDPAHERRLRDLAAALPHPDRVAFVGPRTGADLDAEYAWADLLVVPSHRETYGMVVTEALARRLPCLVTTGSGLEEALGEVAGRHPGLLVPPGDAAALADALTTWWADADLRAGLRDLARRRGAALTAPGGGWDATAAAVHDALLGARA
ncbi:glycosyltransferase family 4 protein [Aquipuribacter nitratireducens]|uniref:Glycosyltransferase family 4 protein n=1 Tax=Aquipuribacter nitratireducens TaxID=650104 RepID=A0ABW0GRN9_9MICO